MRSPPDFPVRRLPAPGATLARASTCSAAPSNAPPPKTKADSIAADSAAKPALAFQLNGRTIDIQAYTRFLRQLEASPWIDNVTPVSAQTIVEKDRPVTAFSIRATFSKADSAYIRTAPFSQSVR